jgi:hypothetical protein
MASFCIGQVPFLCRDSAWRYDPRYALLVRRRLLLFNALRFAPVEKVIMEEKLAETKSVWFRKVAPHKLRDCLIGVIPTRVWEKVCWCQGPGNQSH